RFSVLPVLSVDGIVAQDIFEGPFNEELFINFLRDQIETWTGPRNVVFLDNCAICHDEDVRRITEERS
ncbi:hypothetical protein BDR06DRAFT_837996, partial [Suillus hirtellus]